MPAGRHRRHWLGLSLKDHFPRESTRVRLPSARPRSQVAGPLGRDRGVRGHRRSQQAEVLLSRDVRVSVRARARRPRPQLHHRRCGRAAEAAAGFQRAAPVRVGRLRPSGGERGDQERHPPRRIDPRQHRPHEGAAAASGHQLRVGTRAGHLHAGLLPLESVVVHADVRARPGLSPPLHRELVPGGQHRPRQRAGGGRRVLALRHHRRTEGPGAVVLPHHCLRRRPARQRRRAVAVARKSADDAAQLDRAVGRRAGLVRAGGPARQHRRLHDAHRHDLRRDVRDAWARASVDPAVRGPVARSHQLPRAGGQVPRAGSIRPDQRGSREGRFLHRAVRHQPVHQRARAGVGRQLRAG